MAKRRELWTGLVHPTFGGPVFPVSVNVQVSGADAYPVLVATRNMRIRRAWVAHATAPTGTATYAIRNVTAAADISSATIDADALAVDTPSQFTISEAAAEVTEGDLIALNHVGGTGGGSTVVSLEVEFIELKND